MRTAKIIAAAALAVAAITAAPATASADPAICHNGRLSDDAGQGCADGLYEQVYGTGTAAGSSGSGICSDGILSNDAGQGCADGLYEQVYGSGTAPAPSSGSSYSTSSGYSGGSSTLQAIAQCESGGNPGAISPDGQYRGALQFDQQTWESVGGTGDPAAASLEEQYRRGAILYAQRGSAPWPNCG